MILDGVEDPHNLGAIIRSADVFGAHGVVIPKRRASGITAVVEKASAGALEHMAVAKVTNIADAIVELQKRDSGFMPPKAAARITARLISAALRVLCLAAKETAYRGSSSKNVISGSAFRISEMSIL